MSWTMFLLLWATLGLAVLAVKKHPYVSIFLAILIPVGCVYMIMSGEIGGALVTLLGAGIVFLLQFVKREEDNHQEAQ
ncbi:MAG TPA: hypothetical protein VK144_06855 [Bacillota bacterium]|nr:hypothetical protein [Bacillota bacterium]